MNIDSLRAARAAACCMFATIPLLSNGCSSDPQKGTGLTLCQYDTDCDGSQICKEGACTDDNGGSASSSATGGGGGGGSGGAGGGDPAPGSGGSTSSSPNAPKFLSIGTNVTTLTMYEEVIFTAILTDPQGIGNLIGGSLKADNGALYGVFATGGQEGAYEITISWEEINKVEPISFSAASGLQRKFTAEFFDEEGNSATSAVPLTLECAGWGACDGSCTDLQSNDNHCGSCDNDCEEDCITGKCTAFTPCMSISTSTSCNEICASQGKLCGGWGSTAYNDSQCSDYLENVECDTKMTPAGGALMGLMCKCY